jgi:integrase
VQQTLLAVEHRIIVGQPKTSHGRRRIALGPATVALLREHRRVQAAERLAWGPAYRQADLLFPREDGTAIHPESFAKVFDRRVATSRLPRLSFHGLRHTHASILLAAGVNPKVVSERLGHASVAFTLDIYSHAIPELQEAAASKRRRCWASEGADTQINGSSLVSIRAIRSPSNKTVSGGTRRDRMG